MKDSPIHYTAVLLSTALPVILQTLLVSSKSVIDVLLLGFIDADSVAAAGLASRILLIIILLISSIAAGGGYIIAQCTYSHHKLAATTTLTIFVTVIAAAFAMMMVGASSKMLLELSTHDENLLALALHYLTIITLSFPMIAISSVISVFLRIFGHARKVFLVYVLGLITNVLTTLIFIVIHNWGISGAAWGAVSGTLVELVMLAWCVVPYKHCFWSCQKIRWSQLQIILSQSMFNGIGSLTWALGAFAFYALLGRSDSEMLYILAILAPLEGLLLSFAIGLSTASGIELGKLIPTSSRIDIHVKAYLSLALSLGITLILILIVGIVYLQFPSIFSEVTSNENFEDFLMLMLLAALLKSITIQLINGVIRCGGDVRFCWILDAGIQWGVVLPSAWLLMTLEVPEKIIYTVIIAEETVKILIAGWRFRSDRWRRDLAALI